MTWAEVEAMVVQAHKELVAGVKGLDDEQLSDPERDDWTRSRPLWRRIIVGSFYPPWLISASSSSDEAS